MLVRPAIYAVVRDVQASFGEPLDVAVLEGARHDGGVGTVPVEVLLGHLHKRNCRSGQRKIDGEFRELRLGGSRCPTRVGGGRPTRAQRLIREREPSKIKSVGP